MISKEATSGKTAFLKVACVVLSIILMIGIAAIVALTVHDAKTNNQMQTVGNGLSAYELAVKYGYEGTVEEWLASLNGKSAYEIAKENGYTGSQEDWTAALNAAATQTAVSITTAKFSSKGELIIVLSDGTELNVGKAVGSNGADGEDGANGKDGADGADGKDGVSITGASVNDNGQLVITYSNGKSVNLDKVVGINGTDGIGISKSEINASGELVLTYTNGQQTNLGSVIGADGKDGAPGNAGATGADGKDGISISNSSINANGELVITYSNGTTANLGKVVGADGKDGLNGANGTNGENGISVTAAEINSEGELVLTFSNSQRSNLGKIVGADGKDGKDGISITRSEINSKGELVLTYSNAAVENLGVIVGAAGKDGTDGKDGTNGTDGKDGADGKDGVGIQNITISNAGQLQIVLTNGTTMDLGNIKGADGADGKDGTDGRDGISISGTTINALGEMIISYSDGSSTNLGKVAGIDGADGIDGVDGIGISKTEINAEGKLIVTYTNGTTDTLGKIVGTDGQDGQDGEPGQNGTDGVDGEDGIGITTAEINTAGELVLYFSNNTNINLGRIVGTDGKDGTNGINGADGKDGINGVGIEDVTISAAGELSVKLTSSTTLNLGNIKGQDGIGVSKSEINASGELILTYTNGSSANLGKVVGSDGKDGTNGIPGADGEDGVGISKVTVSADGKLTVTLTDATVLDLGNIKGPQGATGPQGPAGADGAPGKDGADGKDGVSVVNAYIDDNYHLILEMSDGSKIDAGYVGVSTDSGTETTTYTVTFKDHDGTVLKTQTVTSGSSATPPADPIRNGYTFIGWSGSYSSVTANVTVVAQYQQNSSATTYTVTFKDHDGIVLKTEAVAAGNAATAPIDPTRSGYTFTGWDKSLGNITSDTVITAQYELTQTAATTIYVSSATGAPGATDVQVVLSIKNNPGILGMTLKLHYDENAMILTSVTKGPALSEMTFTKPKNLESGCTLPWDAEEVLPEDATNGDIVILTFKILETADAGRYAVSLSYDAGAIIDNDMNPVTVTPIEGAVTVQ